MSTTQCVGYSHWLGWYCIISVVLIKLQIINKTKFYCILLESFVCIKEQYTGWVTQLDYNWMILSYAKIQNPLRIFLHIVCTNRKLIQQLHMQQKYKWKPSLVNQVATFMISVLWSPHVSYCAYLRSLIWPMTVKGSSQITKLYTYANRSYGY